MKNLSITLVIIMAACMLQACHGKMKNSSASDSDSTASAVSDSDDEIASKDTSNTINLVVDKDDSTFALDAVNGNLAEIAMGKLAIIKGRDKKVKNFGAMMVKDHSKSNIKLVALAKTKSITLPAAADSAEQKMITALSKKSGHEFDEAYVTMMIADHKQDVKTFTEQSKKIQDPDLKAFAMKTLPVLQNHLDAINAIHDSMSQ